MQNAIRSLLWSCDVLSYRCGIKWYRGYKSGDAICIAIVTTSTSGTNSRCSQLDGFNKDLLLNNNKSVVAEQQTLYCTTLFARWFIWPSIHCTSLSYFSFFTLFFTLPEVSHNWICSICMVMFTVIWFNLQFKVCLFFLRIWKTC